MSDRSALPILGQQTRERSDAARNRQSLLVAAQGLVDACGVEAVTMDAVAERAGVGKGTVFRRFGSRAGLMAALLDQFEADWQAGVIGGPPPLGPGGAPRERLLAFGRSRLEQNLRGAALIRAASAALHRHGPAYSFAETHVRYLLGQLEVEGDLAFLTTALLAPLDVLALERQLEHGDMTIDRIVAGWEDLADRVISRRRQDR
jgi:AcrR family transcriptional regulator